ncbi:hypothetical protein ACTFQ7_22070 [Bacillus cereus group sp. MYBK226-2]|uniref:hypothetical protein n=1 Tax=Bacillus cereus group sp. MYBK226-2 TaxID=3450655 RepID=UPI003F7B1597
METTKTSLFQILWDGPYNITDLIKLKNEEIDYGIYQIYGNHPVYGNDVLLYIGKADLQTIGQRISQENWPDTNDSNNTKIYVGRFHGSKNPTETEWSVEIDLAERLLIYVHKPAYNSKGISSLTELEFQDIHILNWGNYRSLLPEISGLRWTSKLDNLVFEMYKWV